jgi:hypothetical protein
MLTMRKKKKKKKKKKTYSAHEAIGVFGLVVGLWQLLMRGIVDSGKFVLGTLRRICAACSAVTRFVGIVPISL